MTPVSEAVKFMEDHVLASINDWKKDETAIHKAMTVATNLNHMAEYYWNSYSHNPSRVFGKTTFRDFRVQLELEYPDFALIRDICDAHKHLKLGRPKKRVSKSDQSSVGKMTWGEAKWGEARWDTYCLRYTFASLCASYDVPERVLKALMGHTHNGLKESTSLQAIFRTDQFFGQLIFFKGLYQVSA